MNEVRRVGYRWTEPFVAVALLTALAGFGLLLMSGEQLPMPL